MTNFKRVPTITAILVGIITGFGFGYSDAIARVVYDLPLFHLTGSKAVGFDRKFDDFSSLAGMEYVAACGDS